jgi:hypothetical protein
VDQEIVYESLPQCQPRTRAATIYKGVALYPYGAVAAYSLDSDDRSAGDAGSFYVDDTGRGYRGPDDRLPPAADPNDFQSNALIAPPSLGYGEQPRLALLFFKPDYAETDPEFPTIAYGLQLRPGVFYDTGAFEDESSVFFPGAIALDGSDDALQRGEVNFNEFPEMLQALPFRTQGDVQFREMGFLEQTQIYVDAMHQADNSYRARSVFGHSAIGNADVLVGRAETAFGDLGSAPSLIANGAVPIGAVAVAQSPGNTFNGLAQVRCAYHWNREVETLFSLEDQDPDLFTDVADVPADGVLRHLPAFVGRVRYSGPNNFDSYQLATLIRPIAVRDASFVSHEATGWGVNATARFCSQDKTDALYAGVATGEGIGGYVFGNFVAAVVEPTLDVRTLSNFGTYIAYQHLWFLDSDGNNLSSNVAYGYALSDVAAGTDNRVLHQAWCNLLWNVTDNGAMGLEYQFGQRRIGDGTDGDNHRILFVCEFSVNSDKKSAQRLRDAENPSESNPALFQRRL